MPIVSLGLLGGIPKMGGAIGAITSGALDLAGLAKETSPAVWATVDGMLTDLLSYIAPHIEGRIIVMEPTSKGALLRQPRRPRRKMALP